MSSPITDTNDDPRAAALARHLADDTNPPSEVLLDIHDGHRVWLDVRNCHRERIYHVHGQEWLVLTDTEAQAQAEASAKAYCESIMVCQTPETLQAYIDTEKWAKDAILTKGRGCILAAYDHEEHRSGDYFLYRL